MDDMTFIAGYGLSYMYLNCKYKMAKPYLYNRLTTRLVSLSFYVQQTKHYSCFSKVLFSCFEAALNPCFVIKLFVFKDRRKERSEICRRLRMPFFAPA